MALNKKNLEKAPDIYGWLLILLLGLIWGSSYILIKRGLESFNAGQVGSLRITITALFFLPIFIYRFKDIDWSKSKYFLVVGFAGSLFPAFLFAFAQTKLSSSLTGVLSSTTPLFTLSLGILFFNTKAIWTKILGVIIGLAGTVFLLFFGKNIGIDGNIIYGFLVILGCLLYASSLNTINSFLREIDPVITSTVSFMFIGIPAAVYLLQSGFIESMYIEPEAWVSLGYITLLAFFGTFLGSILFFKLVVMTNALFASLVSYLIPIVALFWGFWDGEVITIYHVIGMILILIGVYLSKK